MASAEYYLGSQGAQQYHHQKPYPPQQRQYHQQLPPQPWPQQQYNNSHYASTPPPSYSPYAQQHEKQQLQAYPPPNPLQQQQHPGPAGPYFPPPPQQPNNYLGVPPQHIRSHSQPPTRVHFTDDASTRLGSETESSSSARPRRRRHGKHRSHDDSARSRDADSDSDHSDRPRRAKTHQKKHDSRDTFLGAGAGGILGDAIFPGLGTAAGLILGGLGGRKYARERRGGSVEGRGHRHRDAFWEGRGEAREERRVRSDSYREGKEERRRTRGIWRRGIIIIIVGERGRRMGTGSIGRRVSRGGMRGLRRLRAGLLCGRLPIPTHDLNSLT